MKILRITLSILTGTLLLSGLFIGTSRVAQAPEQLPVVITSQGAPQFTWSYTSFEKDQIPRTTISLTAKYPNGSTITKVVDTIEGGCNEYADRDSDVYQASQMIICYYAGFGRYYKVVENSAVYSIQRKEFEEASPDYSPPVAPFRTIITF